MSRGKLLAGLGVVLAVTATVHVVRLSRAERPRAHSSREERQVGETIARLASQTDAAEDTVTVVYLFPRDVEPYAARAEALGEALGRQAAACHQVWAREEGLYSDEDYTRGLEKVLELHPKTTLLIVVSVGGVTHARVSEPLKAFLERRGRLLLVGETHPDSPLVKLADLGMARILARRTTWLRDAPPNPALDGEPPYVRDLFTLLGEWRS